MRSIVSENLNATLSDYTGPKYELVYDPETNAIYVQDGLTVGGMPVIGTVSASPILSGTPTAQQHL